MRNALGSKGSLATAPEQLDSEARITAQDIERAKAAARLHGTPLFNAMLDAEAEPEKAMTRTLAYRHFSESVVHLFSDCPEGKIIAIAKRDKVNTLDPEAMKGLELCECGARRESGGKAARSATCAG